MSSEHLILTTPGINPENHHVPSAADIIAAFRYAMAAAGLSFNGELVADGKIKRFRVQGDKAGKRSGWYFLHLDGTANGKFASWKGVPVTKWTMKGVKPLSAQERKENAAKWRADRERRAKELAEKNAKAAERAKDILAKAEEATDDHPYLAEKRVKAHGLKRSDWDKVNSETGEVYETVKDVLLVPIRNQAGITSLQAIYPEQVKGRNKDYLAGGEKKGCFHPVGGKLGKFGDLETICLAEGYATAASILAATGIAVLTCFDANNVPEVAVPQRAKRPDRLLVICYDDDRWTDGNPGKSMAEEAKRPAGIVCDRPCSAEDLAWATLHTDFNDTASSMSKPRITSPRRSRTISPRSP